MTNAQRTALLGMLDAIRACDACPADVRLRADMLEDRLNPTVPAFFVVVVA